MRRQLPFSCQSNKDFETKLSDWIGEVFFELLPERGYEIRDEQIYTSFQIANATIKKKIHFAEAGLGTGKTFAYLLPAIAYARYMGKPAVIACASTALQEQLAGPKGDIQILSRLLGLDIDARLAKDPHQYICDVKVEQLSDPFYRPAGEAINHILDWAETTELGERSEIPNVPDKLWAQVSWDETMQCDTCSSRGYCRLVKARANYRSAQDLLICDHHLFFRDLWTRQELIEDRKLPLLPDYSMVIFDEGHKVLLPAALSAGHKIVKEEIDDFLSSVETVQGARTSLISAALATQEANNRFFEFLYRSATGDAGSSRLTVAKTNELLQRAATLRRALDLFELELQNEQELYIDSLSPTQLQAFEHRVEQATMALSQFSRQDTDRFIVWAEREEEVFWIVPRNLNEMLHQHLLSREIPVIFSSATLSTGGDFSYFARSLGLKDYSGSSVDSPFDYEKQALIYLPENIPHHEAEWFPWALKQLVSLLDLTQGRALVLTADPTETKKIRSSLAPYRLPYRFIWEDSGERGYLVQQFKEDVSSVLVGSGFWEGIDVPGEALRMLVIWQLPFPPLDPLLEARKREVKQQEMDPVAAVDYPEMALKLKQGCGRLIRTEEDWGLIAVLQPVKGKPWEQEALSSLPKGAQMITNPEDLPRLYHRLAPALIP